MNEARRDFIKGGECLHGLAGEVHIGLRFEQADFAFTLHTAGMAAEEFFIVLQGAFSCCFIPISRSE